MGPVYSQAEVEFDGEIGAFYLTIPRQEVVGVQCHEAVSREWDSPVQIVKGVHGVALLGRVLNPEAQAAECAGCISSSLI